MNTILLIYSRTYEYNSFNIFSCLLSFHYTFLCLSLYQVLIFLLHCQYLEYINGYGKLTHKLNPISLTCNNIFPHL